MSERGRYCIVCCDRDCPNPVTATKFAMTLALGLGTLGIIVAVFS